MSEQITLAEVLEFVSFVKVDGEWLIKDTLCDIMGSVRGGVRGNVDDIGGNVGIVGGNVGVVMGNVGSVQGWISGNVGGDVRTYYVKHENDTGVSDGDVRTYRVKYENDTGAENTPEQTELHEVLDGVVLVAADGGPGEIYLDGLKAAINKDAGFWKVLLLSQNGGGFTMTWNAWREVLEKYSPGYLPYFYRSGDMDECGAYTLAGAIAADSSDKPEYLKDFLAFLREGAFRVLINHNPTREITQEWLEGVK